MDLTGLAQILESYIVESNLRKEQIISKYKSSREDDNRDFLKHFDNFIYLLQKNPLSKQLTGKSYVTALIDVIFSKVLDIQTCWTIIENTKNNIDNFIYFLKVIVYIQGFESDNLEQERIKYNIYEKMNIFDSTIGNIFYKNETLLNQYYKLTSIILWKSFLEFYKLKTK